MARRHGGGGQSMRDVQAAALPHGGEAPQHAGRRSRPVSICGHRITMLGTGLIGRFYTQTLHSGRGRDRVHVLYSRTAERARQAAEEWGVATWTTDMAAAIDDPETDVVVIGLPNHLHRDAVLLAAQAHKAVLCTKPLARTAGEALEMLEAVEN